MLRLTLGIIILVAALARAAAAQDEGDVFVGRSAAGQVRIGPPGSGSFLPEANLTVLPTSKVFNGWSGIEPGWDHLVSDQPGLDFLALEAGCQVQLELIQADPGFKAITPGFTVIDEPGERALLGGATLHIHLTWLIDADDAGFDALKTLWRATYKLVDTGTTAYAESASFTFYFANVGCTRGDCNADGTMNGGDVSSFVDIVLYPASHTAGERCAADLNQDGYATVEDAGPFVDRLLAGPE
jgi:hypothetical protein